MEVHAKKRHKPSASASSYEDDQDEETFQLRIYPPPSGAPRSFLPGDSVFFRPKSAKEDGKRGVIVAPIPETDPGHVWVEYESNNVKTKKCVSCRRLVPVFGPNDKLCPPIIILTPETIPYRHLAASQIDQTDDILEIGCSTGEASTILLRYGRTWVGFDSSYGMIQICSAAIGATITTQPWHACKMDALSDPKRAINEAKRFNSNGPTVAFLDIGGNREETGVVGMMTWVLQSFPQLRLLVVKSRELVKSVTNSTPCRIGLLDGIVEHGSTWFQEKKKEQNNRSKLPRHSLQAPLVYSPLDASKPICRYHNYDPKGCKRGENCQYDHEHCHFCLRKGHRAVECSGETASGTATKKMEP
jgi:hypothetical protein